MLDSLMDGSLTSLVAGAAISIVSLNLIFALFKSFKRDGVGNSFGNVVTGSVSLLQNKDSVLKREEVKDSMDGYDNLFAGARKDVGSLHSKESIEKRQKEYQTMVNSFYNLVTDFYEWGWGQSFHFGPRVKGETFMESIKRAEYYLALRAGMGPNTKAIDVGCGVGGPMRNIQQFTGSDITGITINEYQVKVGNQYCAQKGIDHKCRIVQGDFQNLDKVFEKGAYDVAFAIEATCHSPDRVKCFSGVAHALKKGGIFTGYEWVVLPEKGFDPKNPDHLRIKEGIEVGNGLPTLATAAEIVKALEDSGFEVLEHFDANAGVHSPYQVPWYDTLNGKFTLSGFRMTRVGRFTTHCLVTTLETLGIAPKGTVRVSALLNATAIDLVDGGKDEIFTPSYFFVARKK
mmetsp:Transcript_11192/g.21325  ORF Transcript_11192/g.21325 Transcript_11192/m.21325 type:complete len:402 (-) Transcript_11192:93-1298(-)